VKIHFHAFTIDVDTRQVFERDEERHLTPKAFDLLALLIANRPNAISKAQLQERLWPATIVTEGNLAVLVAEIRGVLRDSATRPRAIRTVQRFGYAFCGQVSPGEGLRQRKTIGWLVSATRKFALGEGTHLVGRAPDADVMLNSSSVSRRHARITVAPTITVIEDLQSKNGTWVGGTRITASCALADKDRVRFGSVSLTFRRSQMSEPTRTLRWSSRLTARS